MEFCEKCGSVIVVKDGKTACARCGYKPKKKLKLKTSEKIEQPERIAVIKTEDDIHPQVEIKCPKCKNRKAYFWTMQTRAADESETKFYKCTACKHTWRVYR
jgi:DNA-directed RNA polymerase subunit M